MRGARTDACRARVVVLALVCAFVCALVRAMLRDAWLIEMTMT
jgi:hypothetical protein